MIDLAPEAETVGRVERVGDGIALVSGLPEACLNELLRFDGGRMGFALTLDTDTIGAVLLGTAQQLATVTISSEMNLFIVGVVLVAFVVLAPEGILGLVRRLRGR